MRAVTSVVAASLAACSGTTEFPESDVPELKGFEVKRAKDVVTTGGQMQSGTLDYEGAGDLNTIYREYLAAMKSHGWVAERHEIEGPKATATLKKDNRTCSLQFNSGQQGRIMATIKVTGIGAASPK
jgi:hypothetical protein